VATGESGVRDENPRDPKNVDGVAVPGDDGGVAHGVQLRPPRLGHRDDEHFARCGGRRAGPADADHVDDRPRGEKQPPHQAQYIDHRQARACAGVRQSRYDFHFDA
jgi:hypothetical protein